MIGSDIKSGMKEPMRRTQLQIRFNGSGALDLPQAEADLFVISRLVPTA